MTKKRILVSVTNDLTTDNRVHKVCMSLVSFGFEPVLLGRKLPNSSSLSKRSYKTLRFKLPFNKGVLFYASYNVYLFFYLLFSKFDVLLSNDLDTLLANYLAAKLKGKRLVYDSHELFTEVPELQNKKRVRSLWLSIEKAILPKLNSAYTVSKDIAEYYKKLYGLEMDIIYNYPKKNELEKEIKENIIIYQGAVNVSRGIEEMVLAMNHLNGLELWIVGSGDIETDIKTLIQENNLQEKVKMKGRIPLEKLSAVTAKAKIGLSLEKKDGLSYSFAMPNKVFDYIQSGVPVLATSLVGVQKIFEKYEIGELIEKPEPKLIAESITKMLEESRYQQYKEECSKAALEFNWENQENLLKRIFLGNE